VLFDLCLSIPHSVQVGGARLRFLALASPKPLFKKKTLLSTAACARLSVAVVVDIRGEGRADHCVCICEHVSMGMEK